MVVTKLEGLRLTLYTLLLEKIWLSKGIFDVQKQKYSWILTEFP